MEKHEMTVVLDGADVHITHERSTAYRVLKGTVQIYVVPLFNGIPGKRVRIYDACAGEMLPSFVHEDKAHMHWRFCFATNNSAQLQMIPNGNTSVLRKNLAKKIGVVGFEKEGYENSLVNLYHHNEMKDIAFIEKAGKERERVEKESKVIIQEAFSQDGSVKLTQRSRSLLYDAARLVCKAFNIPIVSEKKLRLELDSRVTIDDIARASHFSYREVTLDKRWYDSDCGPVIGFWGDENEPIVCMQKKARSTGYYITFMSTGACTKLTPELAGQIYPKAYCIYQPFPRKQMQLKDLLAFCLETLNTRDIVFAVLLTIAGTLIGILEPMLNQKVYDEFIPMGSQSLLIQVCSVITAFMVCNVFFSIVKSLSTFRLSSRASIKVQGATFDRLFNLPETFFRQFDSANLAVRVMGIDEAAGTFVSIFFTTFLSSALSLIYIFRMVKYAKKLTLVAIGMVFLFSLIVFWIALRAVKMDDKIQDLNGTTNSKLYQFINGIEKIRMSGSEDRMLHEYLKPYVQQHKIQNSKGKLLTLSVAISGIATTLFSMVFYYLIVKKKMDTSIGNFIAFNSAFGVVSSALLSMISGITDIYALRPIYTRFKPVMDAVPEYAESREILRRLNGDVEMRNVSFSYTSDTPNVLNDVSFRVKKGEYIGIVGPSGCGKSTMLKLLLGFVSPKSGSILYDGKNIADLDKQALRRCLGVVLQDGSLIAGSIFENITIAAPEATLEQVQNVIRAVGLEDDIDEMPMGLQTILSEDSGSISGGQKQRILIARAIIGEPAILLLDEATSALDNITQAHVCRSLDAKNATRIVIAHRLSTIQKCDRILVLDGGRIVEQGSFDELMRNGGLFYQLASRQIA